jgi:hypothetical protein
MHHLAPFAPRAVADAQIFNGQNGHGRLR